MHKEIQEAKLFLEQGNLVAIPTETVYGLAANALDIEAISKIFQAKNRPTFDPLIVHCANIKQVKRYVRSFSEKAEKLAAFFWPGALTLVLPKKEIIPDLVTAGLDTVAVRIPNHPLTLELLENINFPLAAPSANPFGYVSPTNAQHVKEQLGDKISFILDGGKAKIGIESSIISFIEEEPIIYRLGGISLEQIENVIGKIEVKTHSTSNPQAPGMLASHYAPRKKMKIVENISDYLQNAKNLHTIGVLSFQNSFKQIPQEKQIILSKEGSFTEAAQNLFSGMRYLDKQHIDIIITELLPEKDLGRAINDRLRRASV